MDQSSFWHCFEQYPALLHAEHFEMFSEGLKHRKHSFPRIAPTGKPGISTVPEARMRSRSLHLAGIVVIYDKCNRIA